MSQHPLTLLKQEKMWKAAKIHEACPGNQIYALRGKGRFTDKH